MMPFEASIAIYQLTESVGLSIPDPALSPAKRRRRWANAYISALVYGRHHVNIPRCLRETSPAIVLEQEVEHSLTSSRSGS